jgi:hypothetical protein
VHERIHAIALQAGVVLNNTPLEPCDTAMAFGLFADEMDGAFVAARLSQDILRHGCSLGVS